MHTTNLKFMTILIVLFSTTSWSTLKGQAKIEEVVLPNGRLIQINADSTWSEIPIFLTHILGDGRRINIFANHTWRETKSSVRINGQDWSTTNLNVSNFANGDTIFQAKSFADWKLADSLHMPAWCYYRFDQENESTYGKYYNGYAIEDGRNLAPHGWSVASEWSYDQLIPYLGGAAACGKKISSVEGWDVSNSTATNETGFSALPGGYLRYSRGRNGTWRWEWLFEGSDAYFWAESNVVPNVVGYEIVDAAFFSKIDQSRPIEHFKGFGMNVRIVKN